MTEIVSRTKVTTDTKDLTVSTVKTAPNDYDTVVFDDHEDRRHHRKSVGDYVIGYTSTRASSREDAMDNHREALHAARVEPIRDTPQV